jgi:PncC family amidohydrolase
VTSESAPAIAESIGVALRAAGWTLATAESCTGGLVGAWLTTVPGCSAYYLGGAVTYADEAKTAILGVPPAVLARHGAVSAETAVAMAAGVRTALAADVAVAVTGIAGPGGGSGAKPVGTVFIGLAGPGGARWKRYQLTGQRNEIRTAAAALALELVLAEIEAAGSAVAEQG